MFGSKRFNPEADIPDLSEKVILITGGNSGLGKESALRLAKHNPKAIYITARDIQKGKDAITDIKTMVPGANILLIQLDTASLSSVRKAAQEFVARSSTLHILMNNAGVMHPPLGVTEDGYEVSIGTNHVGHALLTKLLMPTLLKTAEEPGADVRVVNISSSAINFAHKDGIVISTLKTPQAELTSLHRYAQSKLANLLHVMALAKLYPTIKFVAIQPGSVRTDLFNGALKSYRVVRILLPVIQSTIGVDVSVGVITQLFAATSPKAETGTFYDPFGTKNVGWETATNKALVKELQDWTENELKNYKL